MSSLLLPVKKLLKPKGRARLGRVGTSPDAPPVALPTPVEFEPFEAVGGALTTGQALGTGAVVVADASWKVRGTNSVHVSPGGTSGAATLGFDKRLASSVDPKSLGVMACAVKNNTNTTMTQVQFTLDRTNDTAGAINSVSFTEVTAGRFPLGVLWLAFDTVTQMPLVYAAPSGLLRYQAKMSGPDITGRDVNFDAWFQQAKGRPKITIHFDDGYKSQLSVALPMLQAAGLKATLHIEYANLTGAGSGSNQRMTQADVTTWHNAGMQVCSQANGNDMTAQSAAASVAEYDAVKANIIANGWADNGSENHISYPGGTWSQALIDALVTAGYLTSRGTQPFPYWTRFGFDVRKMVYPSYGTTFTTTWATLQAQLDAALAIGADFNIHFHDVDPSPSAIGVQTSVLQSFITYIKAQKHAGLCDVMTTTEWYAAANAGVVP